MNAFHDLSVRHGQVTDALKQTRPFFFPPLACPGAEVEIPSIPFSKYHGIGNDFILIDNRESDTPLLNAEQCKEVGTEAEREGG